ncbi:MAG: 3-oxoacyl-[acyl-carrier-protein] synthase 2 [Eubacteriales bacterium SKADARSKE-1]|nr:3-oxoacyl-[acyl-carrier-protein] synthase 2 [Eubacteriales bacterium SKADARSKE-1]
MKRVVVTGVGVMAPGSLEKNIFWSNISSGKTSTGPVTMLNCKDLRIQIAGEIKEFTNKTYIENKNGIDTSFLERSQRLSIAALNMAISDSKIKVEDEKNIALAIGTTMGKNSNRPNHDIDFESAENILSQKENFNISMLQDLAPSSIMTTLCKYFSLKNSQTRMFLNACAAGNYSIGWGFDKIKNNESTLALVGGVDSLSLPALMGFNRLLSLTPNLCRPFDKNRKGLIVSEGAAFLVLEELDRALARNAYIYGEIKGYGLGVDAFHITSPSPDATGAIKSINEALKNSGLDPEDIDYISAHGTGTSVNDKIESKALLSVFKNKVPPVSSIKSMIGHSLGAAAAIEAIACLLMIQNNVAVPTANFEIFDEDCPVDCIPNVARNMKINNIISNAFAFGGNNSCLVISRLKGGKN